MLEELTESVKDTIKSAARKLTGFRRRQFLGGNGDQVLPGSSTSS